VGNPYKFLLVGIRLEMRVQPQLIVLLGETCPVFDVLPGWIRGRGCFVLRLAMGRDLSHRMRALAMLNYMLYDMLPFVLDLLGLLGHKLLLSKCCTPISHRTFQLVLSLDHLLKLSRLHFMLQCILGHLLPPLRSIPSSLEIRLYIGIDTLDCVK